MGATIILLCTLLYCSWRRIQWHRTRNGLSLMASGWKDITLRCDAGTLIQHLDCISFKQMVSNLLAAGALQAMMWLTAYGRSQPADAFWDLGFSLWCFLVFRCWALTLFGPVEYRNFVLYYWIGYHKDRQWIESMFRRLSPLTASEVNRLMPVVQD